MPRPYMYVSGRSIRSTRERTEGGEKIAPTIAGGEACWGVVGGAHPTEAAHLGIHTPDGEWPGSGAVNSFGFKSLEKR